MPTTTYTPIASITLAATASSVVFSGLPQTFRDLILVYTAMTDANNRDVRVRCNGVSTQSYPVVVMAGSGSSALSTSRTTDTGFVFHYFADSSTNANQVPVIAQFLDYSATDKQKIVLARANNSAVGVNATAGRFTTNDAITSVSVHADSGTFSVGFTASLYGIVA
jgi:hypothetical protein